MIRHLGCIMDGNRRWAKKNGVSLLEGVRQGLERIELVVDFCIAENIPYLSCYAFSIENLKRSEFERSCCFNILTQEGRNYAKRMAEKDVRVRIVGSRELFPQEVVQTCDDIERITSDCKLLSLQLLFCYGGRQEIVAAVRNIAKQVQQGNLAIDDIGEELFVQHTWLGAVPDTDLVIRTGYAHRLSGFLTYQSAYSELYFPTCLWPDITCEELKKAYDYYLSCTRNFGI